MTLAGNEHRFFYGYVVAIAAFVIALIAWGTTYAFGVFFIPLIGEFGWTRAVTSVAYSLMVFFRGLFSIVHGRLTDRFGPRPVLTVCALFLGSGYLLMSQITAIWQLYLFYGVIIAVGVSGAYVPLLSTVARWFVKRRGMMSGIVLSGVGVGTMMMPPLAEWLISTHGWRISFIVIGVISLVFIVSAAQFLRYSPRQVEQQPPESNKVPEEGTDLTAEGFSFQQAVRTRQFWLFLGVLFCHIFCVQTMIVHTVPHVIDQGAAAIIAASVLTVIGGGSLAGRVLMGILGDRMGTRLSFAICFIGASVALLWLLVAEEVWMLYIFATVFGFASGGMYVLGSPMAAEFFGLRSHGVIFGVAIFGGAVGGAIGPTLAGHIFDISGSYQMAFLTCAILGVVGLIQLSFLRPIHYLKEER